VVLNFKLAHYSTERKNNSQRFFIYSFRIASIILKYKTLHLFIDGRNLLTSPYQYIV